VRMVDVESDRYKIGRAYMLRLKREDFNDPHELEKLARAAHLTAEEFRDEFGYLVTNDPRPMSIKVPASTRA
jgi:ATP-dependent phosphofructokinase / diphosphate-dependent phosphofructokinase